MAVLAFDWEYFQFNTWLIKVDQGCRSVDQVDPDHLFTGDDFFSKNVLRDYGGTATKIIFRSNKESTLLEIEFLV